MFNKIDCKRTYQVKQWCLSGNGNIWQAAEFIWKMVLFALEFDKEKRCCQFFRNGQNAAKT